MLHAVPVQQRALRGAGDGACLLCAVAASALPQVFEVPLVSVAVTDSNAAAFLVRFPACPPGCMRMQRTQARA